VAKTGSLTFNPGQKSRTLSVAIKGDTLHENAETLLVELTGVTNAVLGDGQAVGTITDNDP